MITVCGTCPSRAPRHGYRCDREPGHDGSHYAELPNAIAVWQ